MLLKDGDWGGTRKFFPKSNKKRIENGHINMRGMAYHQFAKMEILKVSQRTNSTNTK